MLASSHIDGLLAFSLGVKCPCFEHTDTVGWVILATALDVCFDIDNSTLITN
jgi:hypothetical protein